MYSLLLYFLVASSSNSGNQLSNNGPGTNYTIIMIVNIYCVLYWLDDTYYFAKDASEVSLYVMYYSNWSFL